MLACETVPRLQPVQPRGELLGGSSVKIRISPHLSTTGNATPRHPLCYAGAIRALRPQAIPDRSLRNMECFHGRSLLGLALGLLSHCALRVVIRSLAKCGVFFAYDFMASRCVALLVVFALPCRVLIESAAEYEGGNRVGGDLQTHYCDWVSVNSSSH